MILSIFWASVFILGSFTKELIDFSEPRSSADISSKLIFAILASVVVRFVLSPLKKDGVEGMYLTPLGGIKSGTGFVKGS